jgi:transglutaminase-like putative cysteine protease
MMIHIRTALPILLIGALMCSARMSFGLSSKPEDEFNIFSGKYPHEAAIYTLRRQDVSYAMVNDSVITTIKVYEEMLHLGENTVRYAGEKVFSSSFLEISDLQAYTLVPQKKKYERIDVVDFKKSYDTNSDVFYDDTREITFTYPSVQKGVKTVVEYTKTLKDPRMIGLFYFNTYLPVDKAEYTVVYDQQMDIKPQYNNVGNISITEKKSTFPQGQMRITFTAENIEKIKFENNCPSYAYMATSVYCPITYYTDSKNQKHDVISTPEALHRWYRTFIKDLLAHDEQVESFTKTIVNDDDTDLEKVKKIYGWVQDNIKYIAFEDGMRGLIPHPGNYVISKRYGDCKDMTSVTVSMLREVGIEAHYSWIGTRDLPYLYSDVASPITDNHMIATFRLDGTNYFLDATGQYLPLGLPSSMIQGKECMISINENEFVLEKVPIIPKEQNVMSDTIFASIENGVVSGSGKVHLTGYARYFNAFKLIKSNKKSVDDYLQRLLSKGSNKFMLKNYEINHLDDVYTPITINYDFVIPDYYREIGDKIYINLMLDKTMTDALLENRKVPIENDYKYVNRSVTKFNLPEGYLASDLPEDTNMNTDEFGFSIHYATSDNAIVVTREFYIDYLVMHPQSFDAWNGIINEYAKACRKAIILSKN